MIGKFHVSTQNTLYKKTSAAQTAPKTLLPSPSSAVRRENVCKGGKFCFQLAVPWTTNSILNCILGKCEWTRERGCEKAAKTTAAHRRCHHGKWWREDQQGSELRMCICSIYVLLFSLSLLHGGYAYDENAGIYLRLKSDGCETVCGCIWRWAAHRCQACMNVTIKFVMQVEIALVLQRCSACSAFETVNMEVFILDSHKHTTNMMWERAFWCMSFWVKMRFCVFFFCMEEKKCSLF